MLWFKVVDKNILVEDELDTGACLINIKNGISNNAQGDTLYEFYDILKVSNKLLFPKVIWMLVYEEKIDIVFSDINKLKKKIVKLCANDYYIVTYIKKTADRHYQVTMCPLSKQRYGDKFNVSLRKVFIDNLLKEI